MLVCLEEVMLEGIPPQGKKGYKLIVTEGKTVDEYSPEYRKLFIFANYFFSKSQCITKNLQNISTLVISRSKKDVDELFAFVRRKKFERQCLQKG